MTERPAKRKAKLNTMLKSGPSDVTHFLSTGSTLLDLAVAGLADPAGRGGIPCGRFTEFYGPEGSGKSYLSSELLGSAQSQGWGQHLIDTERAFEFARTEIFGFDPTAESFNYYPSETEPDINTVEQIIGIFDVSTTDKAKVQKGLINRIAESKDGRAPPAIAIIDSIAVLSTKMESEGKDKRGQSRAKAFSTAFRQTTSLIADKNIAVVFDNQVRSTDAVHGPKTDSPGGFALRHYCSIRIRFGKPSKIKDGNKVVGVSFNFEVVKNRIDYPYRTGEITLLFDYGIDDIADCANWLKQNTGCLSDKQAVYQLPSMDKGCRGLANFVKHVEDNNLEKEVVELTRSEWRKLYEPDKSRKKRVRV